MLDQARLQLRGEILGRMRRAMKQLEYPLVMPDLLKRGNSAVLELSITVAEQCSEGAFVHGRTNKWRDYPPYQLIKRQP
ncbi:hypothetical protein D3C76_1079750 [compost metagenome]